jgi:hypothetical protein
MIMQLDRHLELWGLGLSWINRLDREKVAMIELMRELGVC